MGNVRIVIDSTARFEDPRIAEVYGMTIVPLQIHIGSETVTEALDFDSEDLFFRMRRNNIMPRTTPPSVDDFRKVYKELSKTTDQILVLTHSRHFSDTWQNAGQARSYFMGRCEIVVIDSMTTSAGLGFLAEAAASANGTRLEDVVRVVRGVVPRLYSVYYVNTLDYIQRIGLIGEAQAILGAMLNVKPLLTIESGVLMPMEKARTQSQAVDKIVEFVSEFNLIDRLVIMQNTLRITEQTHMLQERLARGFPDLKYPVMLYEPLLSSMIGPDGLGIIMLEGVDPDDYA